MLWTALARWVSCVCNGRVPAEAVNILWLAWMLSASSRATLSLRGSRSQDLSLVSGQAIPRMKECMSSLVRSVSFEFLSGLGLIHRHQILVCHACKSSWGSCLANLYLSSIMWQSALKVSLASMSPVAPVGSRTCYASAVFSGTGTTPLPSRTSDAA